MGNMRGLGPCKLSDWKFVRLPNVGFHSAQMRIVLIVQS